MTAADGRWLPAPPSSRQPTHTIVQLSDAHVLADGHLFDRVDACERVQRSFDLIAAVGCAPDVLVLSGDVADRGEPLAYARLRAVLDAGLHRLGAQLLVVPGNHDDVAQLRAYLLGRAPANGPLDTVIEVEGLRVIGMDSSVPGVDYGELDGAQLDALAAELARPAAEGTILVVHHPPIDDTDVRVDGPAGPATPGGGDRRHRRTTRAQWPHAPRQHGHAGWCAGLGQRIDGQLMC